MLDDPHLSKVCLSLPRSVKNLAQTQVDFLCAYRRPPGSPGLSAQRVFHELSWQTRGIMQLGPYTLDKDSLYLDGEQPSAPSPQATVQLRQVPIG